jgi:predicted polyphosphate/ATP-dependent NAD kinase
MKGTDAPEAAEKARALAIEPAAPARMVEVLRALDGNMFDIVAAPGDMGAAEAAAAGLSVAVVVGKTTGRATTAQDTMDAARAMVAAGVELIIFAGGDGTARDILTAAGTAVPAVGVPAGVKMHSAVFAASPRAAAALVERFLAGRTTLGELEVMDIDEAAYRDGVLSARLFGYLKGPIARDLIQGPKVSGVAGDAEGLSGMARSVIERLEPGCLLILGPGTTTRAVAAGLGVGKTLLGIDLVRDGVLVKSDAAEADILNALDETRTACIVVAPIGGQGHVLGRGNQPISPAVIARVGVANITVLASLEKLASLADGCLRVDTGDAELDGRLAGFRRVVTGYRSEAICRVTA